MPAIFQSDTKLHQSGTARRISRPYHQTQDRPKTQAEWEIWLRGMVSRFPAHLRDDLMQTGRIALWQAIQDYDKEARTASLSTFAFACVSIHLKRFLRDNAATVRVPRPAYEKGERAYCTTGVTSCELDGHLMRNAPCRSLETDALNAVRVRAALAILPDTERSIVALHAVENHSFREIAQMTGKSLTSVYEAYHRATEQMREVLADTADTDGLSNGW